MATVTLKTNFPAFSKNFKEVRARFPRSIDKAVGKAGKRALRFLKRNTPKQSGALGKSMLSLKTGHLGERELQATGSPEKYVEAVEGGTGLFGPKKKLIKPKTAKALRWIDIGIRQIKGKRKGKKGSGKFIFAKSVKGFKGFFMFKKTEPRAQRVLQIEITKTVKELAKNAVKFNQRLQ